MSDGRHSTASSRRSKSSNKRKLRIRAGAKLRTKRDGDSVRADVGEGTTTDRPDISVGKSIGIGDGDESSLTLGDVGAVESVEPNPGVNLGSGSGDGRGSGGRDGHNLSDANAGAAASGTGTAARATAVTPTKNLRSGKRNLKPEPAPKKVGRVGQTKAQIAEATAARLAERADSLGLMFYGVFNVGAASLVGDHWALTDKEIDSLSNSLSLALDSLPESKWKGKYEEWVARYAPFAAFGINAVSIFGPRIKRSFAAQEPIARPGERITQRPVERPTRQPAGTVAPGGENGASPIHSGIVGNPGHGVNEQVDNLAFGN